MTHWTAWTHWTHIATIGAVATGTMDLWGYARAPLFGLPRADYRLIGRWFAYLLRGRFVHPAIAASAPLPYEHAIGWMAHYGVGFTFAALMVHIGGATWLATPTVGPALTLGLLTVLAPFLMLQPGMGAGIAGSRTPNPRVVRLQSILTHLVFGFGLYLGAQIAAAVLPVGA